MEPFIDGSLRTPDRLRPEAYVLHMALRKTVLPHGGNRESLTSLQQWLLLSIWRHEQFDFLHFFLSEIEDVIANTINTRWQHMYPHIISYLLCTIDSEKNGPLYNESACEVMTYMLQVRMIVIVDSVLLGPFKSCYPYRIEKDMKWWMQP